MLGHHNIRVAREEGSASRILKQVIIHDNWDPHEVKYDADIAVLVTNRAVEFSTFIQPVCITIEPEINNYNDGYLVNLNLKIKFKHQLIRFCM